ncbi:hypothetical protein KMZ29_06225 [Bradyrhizobium sediminis]|uniref:Uncharacterized protein n=1 Tax=Bradyrhizobium sediminis TaxID=2840469 RepID=A0A975RN29_9BRAD|nr:hypothetical protein [Bradyrhizobium sediminis]QWG14277.1 hypothetical protein KMZ29_06225 [Bradyrhizobium sediminis]
MKKVLYTWLEGPVAAFAVLCVVFPLVVFPIVLLLELLGVNPVQWFGELAVALRVVAFLAVGIFLWSFSRQIERDRGKWLAEQAERKAKALQTIKQPSYWSSKTELSKEPGQRLQSPVTPEIMTLRRYLAKQRVKNEMKSQGLHVSQFTAADVSKAADALLSVHGESLLDEAIRLSRTMNLGRRRRH